MSPKKKALTLTIPEPCSENFNEMIPVKGGKFCGSCEKTIVDFRTMNDYQILKFYQQNKGKICGVFNNRQLNRAMPFPVEVKPSSNWKAIAALAAGVLFSGGLAAQTATTAIGKRIITEQAIQKEKQEENSTTSNRVIRGIVKDGEYQDGLIGANIFVKGTTIGTNSDLDGYFELTIPDNLITFELEVSYIGYDTQTLLFNEKYTIPSYQIEIELISDSAIYSEGLVMGIIIASDFEEAPICGTDKIIDKDDIPEIEPDITTKGLPTENQMTIFPNPFVDDFKISYDFSAQGTYLFNIYNMKGQLLFAKSYNLLEGKQTVELDLTTQNLNNGVYILQLSDEQDRILATKKIYKGQA